jgi:hypothetical protein
MKRLYRKRKVMMEITSFSVNKFNPKFFDLGINLDFVKRLSRQFCDQREF